MAQTISNALLRVTESLAGQLSTHSTKIETISAELRAVDHSLEETKELFGTAPVRLLAANLELQQQLARAKQYIEVQSTQLRARESEARTDLLTTLLNRRAFDEELPKQLSIWKRKAIPFAMLMLDIDHFKRINDTHGHQVGDDILREVGKMIVRQLRDVDIAYRYGGEEFAVVLPMTTANDAGIVAERIRKAIDEAEIPAADRHFHVTTSIGIAPAIAADDPARMIRRADEALYRAKQTGRNCVCWHNGNQILAFDSREQPTPAEVSTDSTKPEHPRPISFTTFNRELTRYVCDKRRSNDSLSVVSVRVDANLADAATKMRECTLPALIELIRTHLQEGELMSAMSAAELILVLPGREHRSAIQWIEAMLSGTEFSAFEETHRASIRYEACELSLYETAEELIIRAREGLLNASLS